MLKWSHAIGESFVEEHRYRGKVLGDLNFEKINGFVNYCVIVCNYILENSAKSNDIKTEIKRFRLLFSKFHNIPEYVLTKESLIEQSNILTRFVDLDNLFGGFREADCNEICCIPRSLKESEIVIFDTIDKPCDILDDLISCLNQFNLSNASNPTTYKSSKYSCHIELVVAFNKLISVFRHFLNSSSYNDNKIYDFDTITIVGGIRAACFSVKRIELMPLEAR